MLAASFLRKEVVRKERCAHGGILWMIRGGAGRAEQRSIWPTSVLDKMERLKTPSRRMQKDMEKEKEGKGMSKIQKKEEGRIDEAGGATEGEKLPEVGSEAEVMKGLLEEANGMLKGMSTKSAEEDRLAPMQRQLDDLKKMKVFRLTKLSSTGPAHGLLDSGATNPLRGRTMNDNMEAMEKVWVTLATGARVASTSYPSSSTSTHQEVAKGGS